MTYHNDTLYDAVPRAIEPLLRVLEGSAGKARANAVGALGNFGRNSAALDADLALQRVPQRCVFCAMACQRVLPAN